MILSIEKGELGTFSESKPLWGDEILVKIMGLDSGQKIKVHARRWDDIGQLWYSRSSFIADNDGTVDLNESEALDGSYDGIDPAGLFYSMTLAKQENLPENLRPLPSKEDNQTFFYFDVEIDGEIVAFKSIETLRMLPEVQMESVDHEDLVAHFYHLSNKKDLPAVIVVSGSEGGIATPDIVAGLLASRGFAVLALAYFEMPGLPQILEEIPLEYIEKAIDWVSVQEVVNPGKIAFMGTSKGAELTLLCASIFSQIKTVIAVSPSCSVFQSLNQESDALPKSSWTYNGQGLEFVPFAYSEEFMSQFSSGYPEHLEFLPLYEASLDNTEAVETAAISVENINGPLLMISSDDDLVWPSKKMSHMVIERLENHGLPFDYKHVSYDGAGHMAGRPGYMPWPVPFYVKGGTVEVNGQAQIESWELIVDFLEDKLR